MAEKKRQNKPRVIKVDFWWANQERLRIFRNELMENLIDKHGNSVYRLADYLRHHPVASKNVTWNQEAIYRLTRLGLPQKKYERVYSGVWTKDLEAAIGAIAPFLGTGFTMESLRAFLCGASLQEVEQIYQQTKNDEDSLGSADKNATLPREEIREFITMPDTKGVREFSRSLRAAINQSESQLRVIATCCRLTVQRIKELCDESIKSEDAPTPKEIVAIFICEKIALARRDGALYKLDELLHLVYPELSEDWTDALKITNLV